MRPHRIILRGLKRLAVLGGKRKVDFVIAGAQKGGTTALDAYLRTHPEIGMADVKEVHFFDNETFFRRQRPPYSKYHSFFIRNWSRKLWGEATPIYMYWREVPERLRQYNPDLKIIMILRNPIDRAYSHWNMEWVRKKEPLSFRDAIHREKERLQKALPGQHRVFSYIDRGRYVEQLQRIWTCFPKNQTLILKNEDLREAPLKTLNEVCCFLRIGRFDQLEPINAHSRPYACPMSREEREYLNRVFEPEIKNLQRLLGWDCSGWLNGPK